MARLNPFWLAVMNVALGVVVVVFVAGVAASLVSDLWGRWRSRHVEDELDRDMHKLFGGRGGR